MRGAQRGFSLVAVVFLIVVLAAVGAFAIQIGTTQQQTVNFALLGSRALAAANAGIEFGSNRALVVLPHPSGCVAVTTLNLTEAALNGFTVTVKCVANNHPSAGPTYHDYALTSRASKGTYGSSDFVARSVVRTITDAP